MGSILSSAPRALFLASIPVAAPASAVAKAAHRSGVAHRMPKGIQIHA